jgi:hypothetical protein
MWVRIKMEVNGVKREVQERVADTVYTAANVNVTRMKYM